MLLHKNDFIISKPDEDGKITISKFGSFKIHINRSELNNMGILERAHLIKDRIERVIDRNRLEVAIGIVEEIG